MLTYPPEIMRCIEHFREFLPKGSRCWVAGGAVRDFFLETNPKDVDLYVPDAESFEIVRQFLIPRARSAMSVSGDSINMHDEASLTRFHVGFADTTTIELMQPSFGQTPQETIDRFDFTVCAAAVTSDGQFVAHPSFFPDLVMRRLRIAVPKEKALADPTDTLKRVIRFSRRGWKIDTHELHRILLEICDPESIDDPHDDRQELIKQLIVDPPEVVGG